MDVNVNWHPEAGLQHTRFRAKSWVERLYTVVRDGGGGGGGVVRHHAGREGIYWRVNI